MAALFLLCAGLLFLPGCWDYEAINTRAPVTGLGIDPAQDDPNKFLITIQFPILTHTSQGQQGGNDGGGQSTEFQNLSVEAYSLPEALRAIQLRMYRKVDIAELRAAIINENLSGDRMDSLIAQLMRLPEVNRLALVLTTPTSAKDVLSVNGLPNTPADFIDKAFKIRQEGFVVNRELWQYWRDTTQVGVVPMIPVVTVVPNEDESGSRLQFGGMKVYKGNAPVFDLDKQQTFYVNLLTEQARSMAIDLPLQDGLVSLTDIRSRHKMKCVVRGNSLVLVDHVTLASTLGKVADPRPKPWPPTQLNELEAETSQYMTKQAIAVMKELQQRQTDVFGFGRLYFQRHPEQEQKMKAEWGQMFEHAKVDIQVTVSITNKGMLI
ncbi:Ger(x)C family spore germination protein [Alicyclobacillus cycloheptanicus]|uniref:Ger(x)C family spore germination protein n=1 Tax=Alicyclobacillus cycloheptanicus TaxID=1457 RepID=UPI0027D8A3EB|nr:Ger(x)C family spore germination protein [Alicyclobacillus cycloheptanicus]